MVRSPLGDTEKRLLGCWGWLGKSKFCRKRNKQPISENMEPVQPGKITKWSHTHHHTCTVYTHIHRDQTITAIVWAISSITWLTNLTNYTTCIQLDDLVSYLFLGQARGSTVLWRLLLLIGFMTAFISAAIPQWFWADFTQRDHPNHTSWTYEHYAMYSIFWIHKVS